jgi:hypothetical protein
MSTLFIEISPRIEVMRRALDPADIPGSVPGVGSVNAAHGTDAFRGEMEA